ncbi:MAG: hypothetical protein ACM3NQ_09340 [Bacteroidales bacterium]
MRQRRSRCLNTFAALGVLVCAVAIAAPADARQLRVSPGPLARAHAGLEGVTQCGKCHDSRQGVSASACLGCHKPIQARIAARRGVHRDVTGNCAKCHVEHKGVDADLRRLDTQTFKHDAETGFVLDGAHAKVAARCAACHKKRSYIAARPACGSCHGDTHKGSLGATCTTCHSTAVPFKETRRQFDHGRAKFALTGAHVKAPCEKCHANGVFRGVRFDTCDACHKAPHRRTLGPTCTTCHITDRWAATTHPFDHGKAGFVLTGAHLKVACASCHKAGVKVALAFDRCAACHASPHRESAKEDCRKCHTETGFKAATFDHAARTRFPLVGKHEGLPCRKCHTTISADDVPSLRKVVDFTGLQARCAACHKDTHKGQYGTVCDACHRTLTFKAAGFTHPRATDFFAGRHRGVECVKCHVRSAPASAPPPSLPAVAQAGSPLPPVPSMACSTCHADVHRNQVGSACDRCHAVDAERFAPTRFSHQAAAFPLTGKHGQVPCAKCHPADPAGPVAGASVAPKRLKPTPTECAACHRDPHLGQVAKPCATCHSTATFAVTTFAHVGLDYTFSVASHDRLPCKSCHKTETRQYPAGLGTALRLNLGRRCVDCHP